MDHHLKSLWTETIIFIYQMCWNSFPLAFRFIFNWNLVFILTHLACIRAGDVPFSPIDNKTKHSFISLIDFTSAFRIIFNFSILTRQLTKFDHIQSNGHACSNKNHTNEFLLRNILRISGNWFNDRRYYFNLRAIIKI